MRENPEAFKIDEYIIPANSIIIQNIYSIHMDEQHWLEPEQFRPERFLDDSGNLAMSRFLMPFGYGELWLFLRFCGILFDTFFVFKLN